MQLNAHIRDASSAVYLILSGICIVLYCFYFHILVTFIAILCHLLILVSIHCTCQTIVTEVGWHLNHLFVNVGGNNRLYPEKNN